MVDFLAVDRIFGPWDASFEKQVKGRWLRLLFVMGALGIPLSGAESADKDPSFYDVEVYDKNDTKLGKGDIKVIRATAKVDVSNIDFEDSNALNPKEIKVTQWLRVDDNAKEVYVSNSLEKKLNLANKDFYFVFDNVKEPEGFTTSLQKAIDGLQSPAGGSAQPQGGAIDSTVTAQDSQGDGSAPQSTNPSPSSTLDGSTGDGSNPLSDKKPTEHGGLGTGFKVLGGVGVLIGVMFLYTTRHRPTVSSKNKGASKGSQRKRKRRKRVG